MNRKRRAFGPRFLTSCYFKLGGGVLTRHLQAYQTDL
nr:MAG TPA: hypothetical protein [Caudoviricetes sp.]